MKNEINGTYVKVRKYIYMIKKKYTHIKVGGGEHVFEDHHFLTFLPGPHGTFWPPVKQSAQQRRGNAYKHVNES